MVAKVAFYLRARRCCGDIPARPPWDSPGCLECSDGMRGHPSRLPAACGRRAVCPIGSSCHGAAAYAEARLVVAHAEMMHRELRELYGSRRKLVRFILRLTRCVSGVSQRMLAPRSGVALVSKTGGRACFSHRAATAQRARPAVAAVAQLPRTASRSSWPVTGRRLPLWGRCGTSDRSR